MRDAVKNVARAEARVVALIRAGEASESLDLRSIMSLRSCAVVDDCRLQDGEKVWFELERRKHLNLGQETWSRQSKKALKRDDFP